MRQQLPRACEISGETKSYKMTLQNPLDSIIPVRPVFMDHRLKRQNLA